MTEASSQLSGAGDDAQHVALLTAETYRQRFEAHQLGVARSTLVLLALVAFWLAIESGYSRFQEGREALASRTALSAQLSKAQAEEEARERLTAFEPVPRTVSGGKITEGVSQGGEKAGARLEAPSNESSAPLSKGDAQQLPRSVRPSLSNRSRVGEPPADAPRTAAEIKAAIQDINKKLEDLRKASVTLSIAGTNLPPQLSLAPVVWLAALVVWLMYFDARRSSAHLNLFAYNASLPTEERRLGVAGEAILWLAPLPASRPKGFHAPEIDDSSMAGVRQRLRDLVGWDVDTERRYRGALFFIALLIGAMAARVAWIGMDLATETGRLLKVVSPFWRVTGLVVVVLLLIVAAVYVTQVPTASARRRYLFDSIPLSRRAFMSGGAAIVLSGLMVARSQNWLPSFRLLSRNSSGGSSLKRPRFVSDEQKQARLSSYRVFATPAATPKGRERLYFSSRTTSRHGRPRKTVTMHAADGLRRVRLFSLAPRISKMQTLEANALLAWVARSVRARGKTTASVKVDQLRLNPDRTNAFELAAVRHLEAAAVKPDREGKLSSINQACNILQAGVRLCLEGGARRPNLRLFDLLAGLYRRYGLEDRLAQLVKDLKNPNFITVRSSWISTKGGRTRDPIQDRITAWTDPESKWRRRWTAESKQWKHTLEPALRSDDKSIHRLGRGRLAAIGVNLPLLPNAVQTAGAPS